MSSRFKHLVSLLILLVLGVSLAAESTALQMAQSLVLPGLAQVRHDHKYGYAMLAAETAIISSMFYFSQETALKKRASYEYALKFAHIFPGDYDEAYLRDLSRYNSSGFEAGGYNAMVREEAMRLFPHDPAQQQIYIEENMYPDELAWNWDDKDNRAAYVQIRTQTQNLRDYGKVAVGVMIVNHLISGLDVLRFNARDKEAQVYFSMKDKIPMLMLNLSW